MKNDHIPTHSEAWPVPDQRTEQEILAPEISQSHTTPPETPAAHALARVGQIYSEHITAADMVSILRTATEYDSDGESVLFAQAHVLDGLFHRLIQQSFGMKYTNGTEDPKYIRDHVLAMALRTQKQCRASLHTLNSVRTTKKLLNRALRQKNKRYEQTIKET